MLCSANIMAYTIIWKISEDVQKTLTDAFHKQG